MRRLARLTAGVAAHIIAPTAAGQARLQCQELTCFVSAPRGGPRDRCRAIVRHLMDSRHTSNAEGLPFVPSRSSSIVSVAKGGSMTYPPHALAVLLAAFLGGCAFSNVTPFLARYEGGPNGGIDKLHDYQDCNMRFGSLASKTVIRATLPPRAVGECMTGKGYTEVRGTPGILTVNGKSFEEVWEAAVKVADRHFEIREQDRRRASSKPNGA